MRIVPAIADVIMKRIPVKEDAHPDPFLATEDVTIRWQNAIKIAIVTMTISQKIFSCNIIAQI